MSQPFTNSRRPLLVVGLVALSIVLSGCVSKLFTENEQPVQPVATGITQRVQQSKLFGVLPVYRPDTQQGNFISQEQVSQLQVGMTPAQVRFLLGTPLLNDVFHAERWDYPFLMKRGDGTVTTSHVVVHFKEGRVSQF